MRTNPEALLISAVVRTGELNLAMRLGASSRLFHVHAEEWRWLERRWTAVRECPSRASFKHQFPDFQLKKTDDVKTGVDLVKKSHARYEMQSFFEEAVELMEAGESDEAVRLVSARSKETLYQIEHTADAVDMIEEWEATYDDVMARVERVKATGFAGVPTGIPSMDKVMGGLQGGWLGIVAARLGVGKTWAAIAIAHAAISSGHDVLFFSLEQGKRQISMRMQGIAAAALGYELNPARLVAGVGVDPVQYRKILEEINDEISGRFLVNDTSTGRVTTNTVRAAVESKKPKLVIVDYIGLLSAKSNEWNDKAALSGDLKSIAEEFDVPVLALAQINRQGTGKDPGSDSLAESDSYGRDADWIATIVNQTERVKRMKLIKFRHGQDGMAWYMQFEPQKGIYREVSGNKAADMMDSDQDEED